MDDFEIMQRPKRSDVQPVATLPHGGLLSAALQSNLEVLVRTDSAIRNLLTELWNRESRVAIFGGWARDGVRRALGTFAGTARDVDIVVDGPASSTLPSLLGEKARENIFGGFTVRTDTTHIDIWPLEKTYLIARQALRAQFDVLPQTTVFRINSIVFLPAQLGGEPTIYERGCLDALAQRVISFQAEEIPLPQLQAARAVMYAARLNFRLDQEVGDMVRSTCGDAAMRALAEQGLRAYCPKEYLVAAMRFLDRTLQSPAETGNGA